MERRVDEETLDLRERLGALRAQQSRLRDRLGHAQKQVNDAKLESLPELQARYHELQRDYDAKRKKHEALSNDLEAKQQQLEMERALARAHYDVITPPTPEEPSMSRAMLKRAGLGGFVGLIFALFAAAILEVRQRIIAKRRW
jgi:uncharacterized protein involved in exopolysaccharide biosynthesis